MIGKSLFKSDLTMAILAILSWYFVFEHGQFSMLISQVGLILEVGTVSFIQQNILLLEQS